MYKILASILIEYTYSFLIGSGLFEMNKNDANAGHTLVKISYS